ncbi:hypothetical protein EYF80_007657 [Liparis tanakae]|uniref:Uncharacterized protein n=1 Tax=Liparis tanakae TaxID=230148 RepID=A0A4Z2IW03_9TELE|nr:hypothetical protein EYF80_007657 [Liparis tanakae]
MTGSRVSSLHRGHLAGVSNLFCHESVLPVPQDKGQEGEDESVQDAHDGQDLLDGRVAPQPVKSPREAAHDATPDVGWSFLQALECTNK